MSAPPRTLLRRLTAEPERMPDGRPRVRCRACRRFFDWAIIDGRFCRPECAGIAPEDWAAALADDQARRSHQDECRSHTGHPKHAYADDERARDDAARLTEQTGLPYAPYRCKRGNLHVGHLGDAQPGRSAMTMDDGTTALMIPTSYQQTPRRGQRQPPSN